MIYDIIIELSWPVGFPLSVLRGMLIALPINKMTCIRLKENCNVGMEVIKIDNQRTFACRDIYFDHCGDWTVTQDSDRVIDKLDTSLEAHMDSEFGK